MSTIGLSVTLVISCQSFNVDQQYKLFLFDHLLNQKGEEMEYFFLSLERKKEAEEYFRNT